MVKELKTLHASMGLFLLVFFINFWSSGITQWLALGGIAFVTFILAALLRWVTNKKLPDEYVSRIKVITLSLLFSAILIIAFSSARLKQSGWMIYMELLSGGVIIGYIAVILAENTHIRKYMKDSIDKEA